MELMQNATGDLGLIVLDGMESFAKDIDSYLIERRKEQGLQNQPESYILNIDFPRFANGEGKSLLNDSVRGKDIYILADVGNYTVSYNMYGMETRKGPDEHFQDIKRALSAIGGKARRVSVIMPLLYASRQHRRKGRESLDCALALQELERLGVSTILTFDVHDPNIQNSIPLVSFENLYPTYAIVKTILLNETEWTKDIKNTVVISPDTGAMDRAIYYAGVLGADVGLFYKRRDFSKVVNGKNPIVAHEYMGRDIKGKNVLIVDDMIASGESVLDIAKTLKKRGAKKVYVAATFALFTEGTNKFDKFYEDGLIDKVFATNLTYVPETAKNKAWYSCVDLSRFTTKVIDYLNYDKSLSVLMDATHGINKLLKERNIKMY